MSMEFVIELQMPKSCAGMGRSESGHIPIIILCLTCQKFLGMLIGLNTIGTLVMRRSKNDFVQCNARIEIQTA